jgi:hypothetical protein
MTAIRDGKPEDQWALAERWFGPNRIVGDCFAALIEPLHRWPEYVRKAFILSLPISGPLWLVAATTVAILFLVTGAIGFVGCRLHYAWRGERSPWG